MAKNLSDWAVKSTDCTVLPHLEKTIKAFHKAGKPLGMCCISPVLAAKILPGCELTVGQDKESDKWVNYFQLKTKEAVMKMKLFQSRFLFFSSSGGRTLRQQAL